jgi:hypothetical protein
MDFMNLNEEQMESIPIDLVPEEEASVPIDGDAVSAGNDQAKKCHCFFV